MLETKLHTYTKVVEDEEYSIIRKNIQDKICNDDVAILANTHKPSFLPLMEDREMALKIWQDTPVVESPAKMVLRNVLNFFQLPFISKTSSRIKKYMHDLQGPSHSASLPDTVIRKLREV